MKQAAAEYGSAVIAAYHNIADTLHASIADAETLAAAVETENAAKVAYDLAHRQMEPGYVGYLALLSAETATTKRFYARPGPGDSLRRHHCIVPGRGGRLVEPQRSRGPMNRMVLRSC